MSVWLLLLTRFKEIGLEDLIKTTEGSDPVYFCKSINYLSGAVTCLSLNISRGVISAKQIVNSVLKSGFPADEIESFLKELAWRDYWQQNYLRMYIASFATKLGRGAWIQPAQWMYYHLLDVE